MNANEVIDLFSGGEGMLVEFKSTLRWDIREGKVDKKIEHSALKVIAAFLNSNGGRLLIGITDDKNVIGLDNDLKTFNRNDKVDEFLKHLDNLIQNYFGNHIHIYLKIEFPLVKDKMICLITVSKSKEPVYLVDSDGLERFYIKRFASTVELKPSESLKYITQHWTLKKYGVS